MNTTEFLHTLADIVGSANVLTSADATPYLTDYRKLYSGNARCVVRPGTAEEVASVVRACTAAKVPMLPQGGNTGLCGGATPDGSGNAVLISLSRLNRIRGIDPLNNTITVEAGCILATIQDAAKAKNRLFPLSMGSEGSCQIGGNLSSNAGGIQVLRYGNARELTLGLEVVLPNGEIWNGLRGLRKDNTGYDIKHLFIGAEGTLGIITAAVLKLFPLPGARVTAWLNVASPQSSVELLGLAQATFGARLTAFELISEVAHALVFEFVPGTVRPSETSPWYVLCEFTDGGAQADLASTVEAWLEIMLEEELVTDAVLAQSDVQAKKLWYLREAISEAQTLEGYSIKQDVSVPISSLPEFISQTDAALSAAFPGIRLVTYGHVGDGNLHYNLSKASHQDDAGFKAQGTAAHRIVNDYVHAFGGSISAEHGLGQMKREEIRHYKSPLEMSMMETIKNAFDPHGLMNPGKVL